MNPEVLSSVASVGVALLFTSLLLARQVRQMEHERNALAILAAIACTASTNAIRPTRIF